MSKFNYTFQRILEIKEKETETAQLQMAKAIKREEKIKNRLDAVSASLEYAEQELENKQLHGVSITELRFLELYVKQLRIQLTEVDKELTFAQKNVAQKQEGLSEKLKEEKIWSTLKEKQMYEFMAQLAKEEQHQLDDISIRKYYDQVIRSEEVGRE